MDMPIIDPLDGDKIKAVLGIRRIGNKVLVYRSTSSTNDIAAEYAKSENCDGLVIFAEEQTDGRGRAGARWFSGTGDSILCSIVLRQCDVGAELLSLTTAVATAEAIGKVGDSEARIKWPNDIRLKDKKVAGILLESRAYNKRSAYIIGIGINCHQKKDSFPPEIRQQATSLYIESGMAPDRVSLAGRLLCSLDEWLKTAKDEPDKVTQRWRQLSIQLGHRVELLFNGRRFSGNCIGIDPDKGLILQLDHGGVRMFDAAHTSVIGP